MVKTPLVSVIVPTYNRADWIGRSVASLSAQTYQNLEVVVVDDSSQDCTSEVVRRLCGGKVRCVRHEVNQGSGAARNTGIRMAKGDLIAFQGDDDESLPKRFEKMVAVFQGAGTEVGVVYCGQWLVDGQGLRYQAPEEYPPDADLHALVLERGYIDDATALIRREVLDKVGFYDERMPRYQDWEFFIRVAKHYRFKRLEEALMRKYCPPKRIGTDILAGLRARRIMLETHFDDYKEKCPQVLARDLYDTGHQLCQRGYMAEGRGCLLKALRLRMQPWCWKSIIGSVASYLGQGSYRGCVRLKRLMVSKDGL